jgi:hypothetical protein
MTARTSTVIGGGSTIMRQPLRVLGHFLWFETFRPPSSLRLDESLPSLGADVQQAVAVRLVDEVLHEQPVRLGDPDAGYPEQPEDQLVDNAQASGEAGGELEADYRFLALTPVERLHRFLALGVLGHVAAERAGVTQDVGKQRLEAAHRAYCIRPWPGSELALERQGLAARHGAQPVDDHLPADYDLVAQEVVEVGDDVQLQVAQHFVRGVAGAHLQVLVPLLVPGPARAGPPVPVPRPMPRPRWRRRARPGQAG